MADMFAQLGQMGYNDSRRRGSLSLEERQDANGAKYYVDKNTGDMFRPDKSGGHTRMDTAEQIEIVMQYTTEPSNTNWTCGLCTFENGPSDAKCTVCGTDRPLETSTPSHQRQDTGEAMRVGIAGAFDEEKRSSLNVPTGGGVNHERMNTEEQIRMMMSSSLVDVEGTAELNEHQRALLVDFMENCDCEAKQGIEYLDRAAWNLQIAVDAFYHENPDRPKSRQPSFGQVSEMFDDPPILSAEPSEEKRNQASQAPQDPMEPGHSRMNTDQQVQLALQQSKIEHERANGMPAHRQMNTNEAINFAKQESLREAPIENIDDMEELRRRCKQYQQNMNEAEQELIAEMEKSGEMEEKIADLEQTISEKDREIAALLQATDATSKRERALESDLVSFFHSTQDIIKAARSPDHLIKMLEETVDKLTNRNILPDIAIQAQTQPMTLSANGQEEEHTSRLTNIPETDTIQSTLTTPQKMFGDEPEEKIHVSRQQSLDVPPALSMKDRRLSYGGLVELFQPIDEDGDDDGSDDDFSNSLARTVNEPNKREPSYEGLAELFATPMANDLTAPLPHQRGPTHPNLAKLFSGPDRLQAASAAMFDSGNEEVLGAGLGGDDVTGDLDEDADDEDVSEVNPYEEPGPDDDDMEEKMHKPAPSTSSNVGELLTFDTKEPANEELTVNAHHIPKKGTVILVTDVDEEKTWGIQAGTPNSPGSMNDALSPTPTDDDLGHRSTASGNLREQFRGQDENPLLKEPIIDMIPHISHERGDSDYFAITAFYGIDPDLARRTSSNFGDYGIVLHSRRPSRTTKRMSMMSNVAVNVGLTRLSTRDFSTPDAATPQFIGSSTPPMMQGRDSNVRELFEYVPDFNFRKSGAASPMSGVRSLFQHGIYSSTNETMDAGGHERKDTFSGMRDMFQNQGSSSDEDDRNLSAPVKPTKKTHVSRPSTAAALGSTFDRLAQNDMLRGDDSPLTTNLMKANSYTSGQAQHDEANRQSVPSSQTFGNAHAQTPPGASHLSPVIEEPSSRATSGVLAETPNLTPSPVPSPDDDYIVPEPAQPPQPATPDPLWLAKLSDEIRKKSELETREKCQIDFDSQLMRAQESHDRVVAEFDERIKRMEKDYTYQLDALTESKRKLVQRTSEQIDTLRRALTNLSKNSEKIIERYKRRDEVASVSSTSKSSSYSFW